MGKEAAFIGEVSRQTGLSIHAIRFYESEGLLPGAARSDSGYRLFSSQSIEQLHFIRKAQEIGFSLDEIRELLVLRNRDTDACSHVKLLVEEKLASVRAKIQALEAMERDLKRVRTDCCRQLKRHRTDGTGKCPVLAKLGGNIARALGVAFIRTPRADRKAKSRKSVSKSRLTLS